MTGLDDESVASQALQEGAQDYLIKGQIERRGLLRALRHAVQRKTMEETRPPKRKSITHSANHDFLTGLPNRMLLNDRVKQAIALAPQAQEKSRTDIPGSERFQTDQRFDGASVGDKMLQSRRQKSR